MTHRVPADRAGHRRKSRALLAGGAVLGLGAVATLAAWSDDVWVVSSFSTKPFSIEASVDSDGTTWTEYPNSPGGDLTFSINPSAMTPGESVFAPLGLRLGYGQEAASISVESAPDGTGLSGNSANFFNKLSLTLHQGVSPTDCNTGDTSTGTVINEFNQVGLSTLGQDIVTLPADRSAVRLCFEVELAVNAGLSEQGGKSGQMVWTFHGEPVS